MKIERLTAHSARRGKSFFTNFQLSLCFLHESSSPLFGFRLVKIDWCGRIVQKSIAKTMIIYQSGISSPSTRVEDVSIWQRAGTDKMFGVKIAKKCMCGKVLKSQLSHSSAQSKARQCSRYLHIATKQLREKRDQFDVYELSTLSSVELVALSSSLFISCSWSDFDFELRGRKYLFLYLRLLCSANFIPFLRHFVPFSHRSECTEPTRKLWKVCVVRQ